MRITTAVVCCLAWVLLVTAGWADPIGAGGPAPAGVTIQGQPGLEVTIESATYLTGDEAAKYKPTADQRVLKLAIVVTDTSGASEISPNLEGVALISPLTGLLGKTYLAGGRYEYSQPVGAWVKMRLDPCFIVPAEYTGQVILRLPVYRFRSIVTHFEWGEAGKPLQLPVSAVDNGCQVQVLGTELGVFQTAGEIAAIRAAGGKAEDDQPHLILKIIFDAIGPDLITALPRTGQIKVTTLDGHEYEYDAAHGFGGLSELVVPGVRRYERPDDIHFRKVTEIPPIAKVSVDIIRKVPVDDNWLTLPPDFLAAVE